MKPSATLVLVDQTGSAFNSELRSGKDGLELFVIEPAILDRAVRGSFGIELLFAMLKSNHTETAVRMATEAGVTGIRVFRADRSIPRTAGEELRKKRDRMQRVCTEAAGQCGRAVAPDISIVGELGHAIESLPKEWSRYTMHEGRGVRPLAELMQRNKAPGVVLAVGPEGSFSDEENDTLESRGFIPAGLGPRVLRAETAAISAVVLAQAISGDMS